MTYKKRILYLVLAVFLTLGIVLGLQRDYEGLVLYALYLSVAFYFTTLKGAL